MGRFGAWLKTKGSRFRLAFWGGVGGAAVLLVYLARHRPSWPWFSLWLFALLGLLGLLSLPRLRRALSLSWFGVTLMILVGVASFDLYLFHVETHRQRSERLEIHGVFFDPDHQPIRVGVGSENLDVRLEGSLYEFDRWSVDLRRVGDGQFVVDHLHQVDMLRLPGADWWKPWGRVNKPAIGAPLGGGVWWTPEVPEGEDAFRIELVPEGKRGSIRWNG